MQLFLSSKTCWPQRLFLLLFSCFCNHKPKFTPRGSEYPMVWCEWPIHIYSCGVFFRAWSHEHMFKLGGKLEDLRNHLLTKAFGKHTKMIFGYCSPQVGMAGAPRGPSGPNRKGRETGSLRAPAHWHRNLIFIHNAWVFQVRAKMEDNSQESRVTSGFKAGRSLKVFWNKPHKHK